MTADESSLRRLTEFAGLQSHAVTAFTAPDTIPATAPHIVATCRSLEGFLCHPPARAWLSARLAAPGSSLFLTGLGASPNDLQTLAALLPGVVRSITPVTVASTYRIARTSWMRYLDGLTFSQVDIADRVLLLGDGTTGIEELIAIGDQPCCIRLTCDGTTYYLVACTNVLDIDAAVPQGVQPVNQFLRFAPYLAYLRHTFGSRCWTNVSPAACFIVDDPLLREKYGFLDFNRLQSRLAASPFAVNIAFIPWNYRRTDQQTGERFKGPNRRFSISVHGCDHTKAEFGSCDEGWLRQQARRALSRMDAHERLTGIKHNRVMVFPQGVFSKVSLKALGDEGFLAAVNSTIYPVDVAPDEITFRDLLDVAVTRFGGTPLFMRHYPDRLEKIALDLFLGRPALIVEHHGFFRNGYEDIARCIDFINRVAPRIVWTDLEQLCASTCLMRDASDHIVVRGFSPVLRLRNDARDRRHFRVQKRCVDDGIESVSWNGRAIHFGLHRQTATCDIVLDPTEEGIIRFSQRENRRAVDETIPSLRHRLKVFARRRLCEVRDNYLERSAVLRKVTQAGKGLLSRA